MEALDRRNLIAAAAGLAGVAMLAGRASAGPLEPPAGPVTSTGKTIGEVEPRKALVPPASGPLQIVQAGSYYLTGDVTGGIEIFENDVTLDLMGFTVSRSNGGAAIAQGMATFANRLTVRNGTVVVRQGGGIVLGFGNADGAVLEDLTMRVPNSTDNAITLGDNATLRRVHVLVPEFIFLFSTMTAGRGTTMEQCRFLNVSDGPVLGQFARLTDCEFTGTGIALSNEGVRCGPLSVVRRCLVHRLRAAITVGDASVVEDCLMNNFDTGIIAGSLSRVSGNVLDFGTGRAIRVSGERVAISGNRVSRVGTGVELVASSRATVTSNTFAGVATPVSGADATAAVGPVVTATNIAAAGNPFANISVA